MKVEKVHTNGEGDQYQFMCPGCGIYHSFDNRWNFNGDLDKPTFSPSLDVTGGKYDENDQWTDLHCHSYVKNGKIQFLSDCSHELAGQTVELLEVE